MAIICVIRFSKKTIMITIMMKLITIMMILVTIMMTLITISMTDIMTLITMILMTTIAISTISRLTTWENLLDSISHVGPLTTNPIQVM